MRKAINLALITALTMPTLARGVELEDPAQQLPRLQAAKPSVAAQPKKTTSADKWKWYATAVVGAAAVATVGYFVIKGMIPLKEATPVKGTIALPEEDTKSKPIVLSRSLGEDEFNHYEEMLPSKLGDTSKNEVIEDPNPLEEEVPFTIEGEAPTDETFNKLTVSKKGGISYPYSFAWYEANLATQQKKLIPTQFLAKIPEGSKLKEALAGLIAYEGKPKPELKNPKTYALTRAAGIDTENEEGIDTNFDTLVRIVTQETISKGQWEGQSNVLLIGQVPAEDLKAVFNELSLYAQSYPSQYTSTWRAPSKKLKHYVILGNGFKDLAVQLQKRIDAFDKELGKK